MWPTRENKKGNSEKRDENNVFLRLKLRQNFRVIFFVLSREEVQRLQKLFVVVVAVVKFNVKLL